MDSTWNPSGMSTIEMQSKWHISSGIHSTGIHLESTWNEFHWRYAIWIAFLWCSFQMDSTWNMWGADKSSFPITEVLSPITYCLALPLSWKIHDVFHAILLTPYKQTDVHGPTHPKPPPNLVEEQEEYEVDHIK